MLLTFAQQRALEEIKIRGRVMVMAVDLEMILLRIILYCLVQRPEEIVLEYKTMTLETKIMNAKRYLLEIHPNKYAKYQSTLKKLQKICLFRNRFSHCIIEWDKKEKDTSYFNILIITEIEEKERFRFIKMTVEDFNKRCEEIRKSLMILADLSLSIEEEFNHRYPSFLNSSIV